MKKLWTRFLSVATLCFLFSAAAIAQTNTWVRLGPDGKLIYTPDAKGNILPDYSYCGYKNGDEVIPNAPVVKTISPVAGNNLTNIQNAINEVQNRTPDANGIRGAILLKAGEYRVSGTLRITRSGVILRGEGNSTTGTRIVEYATNQIDMIAISGSGGPSETSGTRQKISDSYVPVGGRSFNVSNGAAYKVGDLVAVLFAPKQAWIDVLGTAQFGWTTGEYNIRFYRKVTSVSGNRITIDVPLVQQIDSKYADGYLYKYTWSNKIENVGIENLRVSSTYTGESDEAHGWRAITFSNTQNAWVTNVIGQYFGYSLVSIGGSGMNISILNCQMLDPKSKTEGGRKYSFDVNGQLNLVKNCYTRGGRHDYVTGAQTAGPNAFVSCKADQQHADIGPHHRWGCGALFDNVISNGEQNVQNRTNFGTGHGWAGAQTLYYNCTAGKLIVQSPPQHMNWAIGCKGNVTDVGYKVTGFRGIWQSIGTFVTPQSIYEQQVKDRKSPTTPVNVAPTASITSPTPNATFLSPASVSITANAADSDGTVTKVEFYNGSTLLGTSTAAPYAFNWTNVSAGTYALTVKATDDKGAVTTSAAVNITVNAPVTCQPVSNSSNDGNVAANVLDGNLSTRWSASGDGQWIAFCFGDAQTINGVQIAFYSGNVRQSIFDIQVSDDGQAWTNVLTGVRSSGTSLDLETFTFASLTTKNVRILGHGNSVNAWNSYTEVKMFNGDVLPPPNVAPTTAITAPANNTAFTAPASVSITANATDGDGTIAKVEFYNGSTLLATDATAPYSYSWTNVAAGTYSLTVKATDDDGAVTTSSVVTVKVNAPVTNTCSGVAQYKENGGYVAGSIVQNAGVKYQCKPWPYSGWCNGGAAAYAPGTGSAWGDAWTRIGTCTSARVGNTESTTEAFTLSPNPASGVVKIESEYELTSIVVVNQYGEEVYHSNVSAGSSIDLSSLSSGIYLVKIQSGEDQFTQRLVLQ